jgi:predicted O-methyltransferase YrrM
MQIVAGEIEKYLASLQPARDAALVEMERLAAERGFPIVGPLVGAFLELLARAVGAKRVLELGSGFGYSAFWFARAGARVVLTEYDPRNLALARKHLAGFECEFHAGDAFDALSRLEGPFDIVFCDIDKMQYPRAWKTALPKVRAGGLFITDNTLWYGRVAEPAPDEDTQGVLEYNRLAFSTPGVITSILPLRDGVAVSLKS